MPDKLSKFSKNKIQNNLLIFIVAYEAAETIIDVLNRIPDKLPFEKCEILIIDDASNDETFDTSFNFVRSRYSKHPVTILKNPRNQGYGGNQKLGYRYAIDNNYDIVVLLHGDGQYAPESMPQILAPFTDIKVDAVFGSRMLSAFGALKGGMPLYKYFGNKILTFTQNFLLKSKLSEFHSGYRAYRVSALQKIPFETNANVFHFDTEIIIQLLLAECTINEVPIPTFYGDEICRVNGLKYAWDIISATFVSRLQSKCICYRRQFDLTSVNSNIHYKGKFGFPSSHEMALSFATPNSHVLDLGCGPGYFASELKKVKGCKVVGVDKLEPKQKLNFDAFYNHDLEKKSFLEISDEVDLVYLLDVIEELSDPEVFLRRLSQKFQFKPYLDFVISTPNVAFVLCRLNLLLGRFIYSRRGILDLNHKRLFTYRSICSILNENGFEVISIKGIPPPFRSVFRGKFLPLLIQKGWSWLVRIRASLFAYQFVVNCKITPNTATLLQETINHSDAKGGVFSPKTNP